MMKESVVISMLVLFVAPAWGSTCTSSSNPCTAASASGADTTDRDAFNSDTLNTAADLTFTNITFDESGVTAGSYPAGLVIDDVTFTGLESNGETADLQVQGTSSFPSWGSNVLDQHNDGGTITVAIPLSSNVYAFGVDLLDISGTYGYGFSLSVNGGTAMTSAATPGDIPGSVFFGYTSAVPITSVSITTTYPLDVLGIDNFELGEGQDATPEVSTMLLIGTGLIAMRFIRRRRTRHPS